MPVLRYDTDLNALAVGKCVDDLIRRADCHHIHLSNTYLSDLDRVAEALVELGARSVGREDFDPVYRVTVCRNGEIHYIYLIGDLESVRTRLEGAADRDDRTG